MLERRGLGKQNISNEGRWWKKLFIKNFEFGHQQNPSEFKHRCIDTTRLDFKLLLITSVSNVQGSNGFHPCSKITRTCARQRQKVLSIVLMIIYFIKS